MLESIVVPSFLIRLVDAFGINIKQEIRTQVVEKETARMFQFRNIIFSAQRKVHGSWIHPCILSLVRGRSYLTSHRSLPID